MQSQSNHPLLASTVRFLGVVVLGMMIIGPWSAISVLAQSGPDNPADMTDGFKWQALRLKDEFGRINPKGIVNAFSQRQALVRSSSNHGVAGLPTGSVDNYTIQTAGTTVSGLDPTKWTWLGPGNIGGRTRSILADPSTPTTLYAGSVGGGVWKSTNSGASWSPTTGLLGNLASCCMAMSPTNSKVIYVGTGEGFFNGDSLQGSGIYKTTDGGTTWSQLSSTSNANFSYVNRIAISPNGATMLAATNSGVFRSTDGGSTFTAIGTLNFQIDDIDFNPTDSTKCVCGGGSFTGNSVAYYSTTGGATWTQATGLPQGVTFLEGRVETTYALANPSIVYASVAINSGTIYSSTDGGQTYTAQTVAGSQGYLGNQGWYANTIWAADPNNANRVIVGGLNLWTSTDGGQNLKQISTWQLAPSSAHADHHVIFSPSTYNGTTNQSILFGNDGGIYRADNVWGTVAWTDLNNNYGVTQFYGGAGNPTSKTIVGGAQDNGSLTFTGNAQGWNTFAGGDGGFCAADATDPNYFYGEYVYLQIYRSSDAAVTSTYIYNNLTDAGGLGTNANFISPFILDPNNYGRMLGGGLSLWVSNNVKAASVGSVTWASIKPSIGSLISAIAVNPKVADQIWVGHNNGNVYMTTNGTSATPTWTQVGAGTLPARYCERLAVDPTNGKTVFATFGGFTSNNVWKTTNSGTSWNAVGGVNLPQSPTHTVAIHPANNQWVYVGTEVGVFASQDGGTTWSPTNQGPINVSVDELFFIGSTTTADLVAATHGRGMYKITPTASSGGGGGSTPNYVTSVLDKTTTPWTLTLTGDKGANAVSITQQGTLFTVQGAGLTLVNSSQQQAYTGVTAPPTIICNFAQSSSPATSDSVTMVTVNSKSTTINFYDGGLGGNHANLTYCTVGTLNVDGGAHTTGTPNVLTLVGTKITGSKTVINVP